MERVKKAWSMGRGHKPARSLVPAALVGASLLMAGAARAEPPAATPAPAAASTPAPAAAPAPAPASVPASASAPAPAAASAPAPAAAPPPAAPPPGAYAYPYPYPYPPPPGYAYPTPYGATWERPPPPLEFSRSELPPEEDGPMAPQEGKRKANTGKAGKILVGVGLGLALVGGLFVGMGAGARQGADGFGREISTGIGGVALVAGGISLAVGIPLWAASPR